jgi:NADPH2:quinone reductase
MNEALIFRETGEPSGVLKLAESPIPPLAHGEALVRVLLSPIHPSDLHMVPRALWLSAGIASQPKH